MLEPTPDYRPAGPLFMSAHVPQSLAPRGFAERHGAVVISAVFHGAFLVMLQNMSLPEPRPASRPEPEPIRIELAPVEQTAPLPMPPMPPVVDWSENVATVADAASEEPVTEAERAPGEAPEQPVDPEEFQIAALSTRQPTRGADAIPYESMPDLADNPDLLIQDSDADVEAEEARTDEAESILLDERIKAYLEDRERRLTEYNDAVGQRGSDLVAQKLSLARASLEGKRWLETTEGGQEGAIRSFTSSGVSPKIAEEVYARYGIKAFDQFIDSNRPDGTNFLNSAKIGDNQFVRREVRPEGRGVFRVLSIPQSAYAFLATLERDALIEQGHDPARTRILEVEFGIASVGRQYDLVVTRLKVAPMEFGP